MQSSLSAGTDRSYDLTAALLVYGSEIATLHQPVLDNGRLTLGEGTPLTEDALRDLSTRPVVGRCRVAIVEGAERLRDVAGNRILARHALICHESQGIGQL